MPHEPRQPVGNPDGVSHLPPSPTRPTWPQQQGHRRTATRNEHREIRASNPAELAEYAADSHGDDSDDASRSYVDLGFGDDYDDMAGADEFGFDSGDQVDLDAA